MTTFDYVVLGIIGMSVVLAVMRGLVKELLSLLTWIVAYLVAQTWCDDVIPWLPVDIPGDALKLAVSFLLLLFGTWLLMALLTLTLGELIKAVGLSLFDRLLGAIFGLLRGSLIVLVLVIVAGLTHFPQTAFWQKAAFSAPLESLALAVKPLLPDIIAAKMKY